MLSVHSHLESVLVALIVGFVLLFSFDADAEQSRIQAAVDAYARGELDTALEGFESALEQGTHPPDALVTIYTHLGVLRGATGDLEGARQSFEIALAMNPNLATPSEAGGQMRELFESLREARSGRALTVELRELEEGTSATTGVQVDARVLNAPPGFVSSVRLRAALPDGQDSWSTTVSGQGASQISIPSQAWGESPVVRLHAAAVDEHGNRLVNAERELSNPRTRVPTPTEGAASAVVEGAGTPVASGQDQSGDGDERRQRRVWYRHPAFWIVVGALVVGGVVTGVVLGTAETETTYGAPQVR